MERSSITLKELSVITGFSVSTISKALNNKEDVNESTKEFIQKEAKKINYSPNYSAISLRKQRTKTIATIVPNISDSMVAASLSEIQRLSFFKGYKLLVLQSFGLENKEKECLKFIHDGSVDGVIVITSKYNHENICSSISIPYVLVKLKNLKLSKTNLRQVCSKSLLKLILKTN